MKLINVLRPVGEIDGETRTLKLRIMDHNDSMWVVVSIPLDGGVATFYGEVFFRLRRNGHSPVRASGVGHIIWDAPRIAEDVAAHDDEQIVAEITARVTDALDAYLGF